MGAYCHLVLDNCHLDKAILRHYLSAALGLKLDLHMYHIGILYDNFGVPSVLLEIYLRFTNPIASSPYTPAITS